MDIDVVAEGEEAAADAEQETPTVETPTATSTTSDREQAAPAKPAGPIRALASPACRYLAMQHNIKLEDVTVRGHKCTALNARLIG